MLQFYNKNRDELIGVEPNRDELKSNYLKAWNDNKHNYKIKDPFFRKFDKEMKSIQESICNLPEYADIFVFTQNAIDARTIRIILFLSGDRL
jgi:hypothetical protein